MESQFWFLFLLKLDFQPCCFNHPSFRRKRKISIHLFLAKIFLGQAFSSSLWSVEVNRSDALWKKNERTSYLRLLSNYFSEKKKKNHKLIHVKRKAVFKYKEFFSSPKGSKIYISKLFSSWLFLFHHKKKKKNWKNIVIEFNALILLLKFSPCCLLNKSKLKYYDIYF